MVCLGFEPRTSLWCVQTNPLLSLLLGTMIEILECGFRVARKVDFKFASVVVNN